MATLPRDRRERMRRQLVDACRRVGPMRLRRHAQLLRVCAAAVLTALTLGAATAAEKPFKAPRTSDGQPDLQGYWTNNTVVPLQRPAAYADRTQLTEAEARERLDKALEPSETEAGTDADVHYQLTDYGLDITQRKMNLDTRTAAIVDPPDGVMGDETRTAIRDFQTANGLSVDGSAGPKTRKVLFRAYMDALCGPDLLLDKAADFLAQDKDGGGGKGDFQGCSEFNPLRVFSKSETAVFAGQADHTSRNQENAPNRRVVALLFAPGRRVNPAVWPCPRAKEGTAACKKRFFPDAAVRRSPQTDRREFEDTKDTFACRFYQIISDDSPCERVKPAPPPPPPPPPPVILGVNPLILFAISQPAVATAATAPAAQSFVAAGPAAVGAVTPLQDIVLVKKPYTNPRRVEVVLKTDTSFDGTGLLSVTDNSIVFFATASSPNQLLFNGIDNRFTGAQLDPAGAGVHLFAEGRSASTRMGAFQMRLALSGGTKRPGPDALGNLTAIDLVLDIGAPRVNATTAPVPLPQAPAVKAATPNDKFFLGRPVPLQDDAKIQERAMLIVQPVTTTGFAAQNRKLVLVHIGTRAKTFAQENPSTADVVIPSRHTFFPTSTTTTFFVEGAVEGTKAREDTYQLGIDGLDGDGDRVSVTVVLSEIVSNRTAQGPPRRGPRTREARPHQPVHFHAAAGNCGPQFPDRAAFLRPGCGNHGPSMVGQRRSAHDPDRYRQAGSQGDRNRSQRQAGRHHDRGPPDYRHGPVPSPPPPDRSQRHHRFRL